MNKVELTGRLTREPEERITTGAEPMTVARFTLAVDRDFAKKDAQDKADFIRCVAFGKKADALAKYGKKGTKLGIVGRIQTGSYTNKEGQKVYTTDIVVESWEFEESKKTESQQEEPSDFMQIPANFDGDGDTAPF